MHVHPSQLIQGCIVVQDIMGQTRRPIIPKHTVINPLHIKILHKFNVQSIEVGSKLSNGSPYFPKQQFKGHPKPHEAHSKDTTQTENVSFQDHYLEVVTQYKQWFSLWQRGSSIDMTEIRNVFIPLLKRAMKTKRDVFLLHHYSTATDYSEHHCVALGLISGFLAAKLGYTQGEWIQVGLAGLFSDCGMTRIEETILNKNVALSQQEYEEVKKHPTYSYRLVENIPSLNNQAKLAILQHHERLDGSGYPLGLKQDKIHLFSQIIAVSDMYHAMTSERVYRKKQSPFRVLEAVLKEQFGRYDHQVIQAFVKELTNYSTGTRVRLTNNQLAEIIFVEPSNPTRPMIRFQENGEIIHLKDTTDIHIEEIFD
ncbi:HD-GYP domain-containing protein [Halobacillus shinanisalinarum]|uniref:HD-GYP domain-containing protein n=1 Tax=Halobacillus shinanisalinarum TaxID=2932258 RepID=A0ABY4H4Y5_9BACI|nr:HD-GYP domain-containing protein [Halobacillus shinanisalinarum]UOQ95533.1 HD-GYP domain-containing protein [Halobacillus shinanisalinarum]